MLAAAPPQPRVLDVGAGTGLSAGGLARHATSVVAVDVARAMLAANPSSARVVGAAESLPMRDGSFDLAMVAQAFHWLRAREAYPELARVLTPSGVLAVWWKYHARDDASARAVDAAYERVVGGPAPHTPMARGPLPLPADGLFARVEPVVVPWQIDHSVDAYVGYQASREILRKGAGLLRKRVLAEMRRELDALHPSGQFAVRYEHHLWLLHKA